MALEANHVARSRRAHLPNQMVPFQDAARSVLIVAIGARYQSLVHAMAKRHIELSLLLQVARIAKPGLRFDEHVFFCRRVVHGVAGRAAHIVLPVERIRSAHVLRA